MDSGPWTSMEKHIKSRPLSQSERFKIHSTPERDSKAMRYSQNEACRFPFRSRARCKQAESLELAWNSRFHVAFSRKNNTFHRNMREYFGRPKPFEPNAFDTLAQKAKGLRLTPLKLSHKPVQ